MLSGLKLIPRDEVEEVRYSVFNRTFHGFVSDFIFWEIHFTKKYLISCLFICFGDLGKRRQVRRFCEGEQKVKE